MVYSEHSAAFWASAASTAFIRIAFLIVSLALGTPAHAQTTVTLMRGLNGYAGVTDALIASDAVSNGAAQTFELRSATLDALLIRFAIFQSESGPIPNGSTISSATLSMYRF